MSDGADPAVQPALALRLLPALALLVFVYALFATAWICDDAYITFRTLRNFFAGDGLTWNPGVRVQGYTHPSWLLLCMLPYSLTGECFFSILGLCLLLSCALAALLLDRLRDQPLMAASVLVLLSGSVAFVDYAVCGLENPLLFLLLALFCRAQVASGRGLLLPGLLVAAIALTRLDAVLLVAPSCLELIWRRSDRLRAAGEWLAGCAPLALWELFSIVYYGSPVPNTAIAKLNLDVPAQQLLGHGAAYFVNSLQTDPTTLIATAAGVFALARTGERRDSAIVLGLLAYIVYLLCIGGDFMSGRFCGALLVFTLAALAHRDPARRWRLWMEPRRRSAAARAQAWLLGAAVVYALVWPRSPWHLDLNYGAELWFFDVVDESGIADERAYYYPSAGLLPVLATRQAIAARHEPLPPHFMAVRGRALAQSDASVARACMVGFYGYFAADKHVIDCFALTDPFLARIPFRAREGFRPGHFRREEPEGYLDSVMNGKNVVRDPKLARLYDRVQRVVSGPLFSRERWRAIACLNGGACDP